jgi:hypothetical protein
VSNSQECAGVVDVEYGETVRESWDAHQTYRYEASDACYFRNVTSHGNDVVSDHSDEACVKGSPAGGIADRRSAAAELLLGLELTVQRWFSFWCLTESLKERATERICV